MPAGHGLQTIPWVLEQHTSPPRLEDSLDQLNHESMLMILIVQEFAIHHKIFKKENGGYTPALNSYRALIRGLNVPAENNLTAAQQTTNLSTLYIGVTDDPEVDLGVENFFITSFSSQPTLKNISAGHWPQLQHPDTVNNLLKDFFDRKGS